MGLEAMFKGGTEMSRHRSVSIVRLVGLSGIVALALAFWAVPAGATGSATVTLTNAGSTCADGVMATFSWSHFHGKNLAAGIQLSQLQQPVLPNVPPVGVTFWAPYRTFRKAWGR
jgi:hypothetical protein